MVECKSEIITRKNLHILRDFIQKRTGIFFAESKFFAIENHIHSNFLNSQCPDFNKYFLYLKSISGEQCLKNLISLLTTNETYFFRGKEHFDLLEKSIFPDLISKKAASSKTIFIWCAGCSTGEEPYSLAILLKKFIYQTNSWKICIVASDIDEAALNTAIKGEYSPWSFRGVDSFIMDNCFIKNGEKYQIKEEYKDLVQFRAHNLILDPPPFPGSQINKFDIIFCRNVTIYFEKETTRKLASKFYNALNENGYLMVGHSENASENYPLFKTRPFPKATIYQKTIGEKSSYLFIHPANQISKINRKKTNTQQVKNFYKDSNIRSKKDILNIIKEKKTGKVIQQENIGGPKKRNTTSEETKIFSDAWRFYGQKNYSMAIDRFLRIISANPSNARACWMISHIAANSGDFEEALAWANRVIEIDPLFKESYYTLSLIHFAQGEFSEAESKIKKSIYIDQNFVLGYFMLGNIYVSMGLSLQANKQFRMVSELLASKSPDEIIFQAEDLAVEDLLKLVEINKRKI